MRSWEASDEGHLLKPCWDGTKECVTYLLILGKSPLSEDYKVLSAECAVLGAVGNGFGVRIKVFPIELCLPPGGSGEHGVSRNFKRFISWFKAEFCFWL